MCILVQKHIESLTGGFCGVDILLENIRNNLSRLDIQDDQYLVGEVVNSRAKHPIRLSKISEN